MKKAISFTLAMVMALSTAVCATAETYEQNVTPAASTIEIQPFASEVIRSCTYSVSSSRFEADVSLKSNYTGTAELKLEKKVNGSFTSEDSTSKSFTNASSVTPSKSVKLSSGTYKLTVTVTVNGTKTVRYSNEITI